jgi:uncharacterized glyoxalase superfamily protein PhnB
MGAMLRIIDTLLRIVEQDLPEISSPVDSGSADQEFMINYRVENLKKLVSQLKKEGVRIVDDIEEYNYGKFVHILDAEGNRVELWEPNDEEYDRIVEGRTK